MKHNFCCITPVWGNEYVKYFTDYSLPSQLAKGNLESICSDNSIYCIYTTQAYVEQIRNSPAFKQLESFYKINLEVVDAADMNSHELASNCFRRGIFKAQVINAVMLFLTPDTVFARNSFNYLKKMLEEGYRAIMAPCMTFEASAGCAELVKYINKTSLEINGRECIDLVKKAMHSNTREQFYEEEAGNMMPGSLYWYVGDQGMLTHSFHLHPILVFPKNWDHKFAGTVDGDYVVGACPQEEDILLVKDNDDFCMIEMANKDHIIDACHRKGSPSDVVDWAIIHANAQHRQFFAQPLYLKCTGYKDNIEWHIKENITAELVAYVEEELVRPLSIFKLLKYRYAYIRYCLLKLRHFEKLYPSSKWLFFIKVINALHRYYVCIAQRFVLLKVSVINFAYDKGRKSNSIFSLYFWTADAEYKIRVNTIGAKCIAAFKPLFRCLKLKNRTPILLQICAFPIYILILFMATLSFNVLLGLSLLFGGTKNIKAEVCDV